GGLRWAGWIVDRLLGNCLCQRVAPQYDSTHRSDRRGWTRAWFYLRVGRDVRLAVWNLTGAARFADGANRGAEGGRARIGLRLKSPARIAGRIAGGVVHGVADGRGFVDQELCAFAANVAGLPARTLTDGACHTAVFQLFNAAAATKLR